MQHHKLNHVNLRLESAFDCFQATAEKKMRKDYITCNTSESTQVTPNLSQSTLSKNGPHSLLNNNLISMVSGINGGLNHISSLQAFEQCNYQSTQSKGSGGDPRYAGPQGTGMLKYNAGYKQNQGVRIGQCRSHDKIVGGGSQSYIAGSTTSLRDEAFPPNPQGFGHNFQIPQSNQSHYHKMLKSNQASAVHNSLNLMVQERMNLGQNSNQIANGSQVSSSQSNFKQIRQLGCRSNDNELERNQRKAILEVAQHHLQSSQILGQSRRTQQQMMKTKTKVMNPSIIQGNSSRNDQKMAIFGSNESILKQSGIGGGSKSNQNSRSKHSQKQKQAGTQSGSIVKTTKVQPIARKRGQGTTSTSQHSFEPQKENVNSGNGNRVPDHQPSRAQNQGSSVVASQLDAQNLRSLQQQNSNNMNVRRNFGSNDSYTNAAPQQKKYTLANRFQQSKSSVKMRDLKMSSVLLNQPKKFEQNEVHRRPRANRGPKSKKTSVQPGEHLLQSSQLSYQNYGEQTKSAVSTHGNGSENVSVCTAEATGPQFLRQVHATQLQNQPPKDISKQVGPNDYSLHGQGLKQADSHTASQNQDLVALSNSDLNLLGEFHYDNTQAQSFAYTDSTIQTEPQRLPPNNGQNQEPQNKLDGRFSMHHHPANNAAILEHLGLGHRSNNSCTSSDSRYSDCKSRDSCGRPEIQINDSSDFKRGELHQANMNLLAHRQNEMRIEDMKPINRHANVGTGLKSRRKSSEQKKNGIFEKIRDFGADDADSYSEYSASNQKEKQIYKVGQNPVDQVNNRFVNSSSNNQININEFKKASDQSLINKNNLSTNQKTNQHQTKSTYHEPSESYSSIQDNMTDKENAAAAPASSLIAHMGKRESFLAGATQIGVATTKAAASNRLITCKDLVQNPRSQQVVPAKAVGLLSIQQQQQAIQRGNAGSRQKTDTTSAHTKAGLVVAARDNTRKTFRPAQVNDQQRRHQVRQFKSLSNVAEQNTVSTSNETVSGDNIQPLRVNKNLINVNSSIGNKVKEIKLSNLNDKMSPDECRGFDLQRVPTTSTVNLPNEKKSLSKTRSGSQNKSDKSGTPAPSSLSGQPKININITPPTKTKSDEKKLKLVQFRQNLKQNIESGDHYGQDLKDIHQSQQEKELLENVLKMGGTHPSAISYSDPVPSPIAGHEVTKEYRTKMTDWMVEVCTSFKCSTRTYFLAVQIFDKYLTKLRHSGKVLQNKDVHCIGVTAMYLGSKYEDIFPLHSKIVSEKIAHKAIPSKDILKKEAEFLRLFDFEVDFITHYDFYQTYSDKLERQMPKNLCQNQSKYTQLICEMGLLLVKMAMQNNDFTRHSPSILVISAFYAATAFLKHSKKHDATETNKYCTEARKVIFSILEQELRATRQMFKEETFLYHLNRRLGSLQKQTGQDQGSVAQRILSSYQKQFSQDYIEKIAMNMVDFFKIFDEWHCGLNQLKKFNKVPIE